MKDLIDIVAQGLGESDSKEEILSLVETIYFSDARRFGWLKSLFASDSTLIAQDIVRLTSRLKNFNSISGIRYRSRLIEEKIDRISGEGVYAGVKYAQELDEEQRGFIEAEVIEPHRSYVTAVMLVELIRDESRRSRSTQLITYLVAILTALITASAVVLTHSWGQK